MILGNEQKLYTYLKERENPYYCNDSELIKALSCSQSSLTAYRKKLKENNLLEYKSVFRGKSKVIAYEIVVGQTN